MAMLVPSAAKHLRFWPMGQDIPQSHGPEDEAISAQPHIQN
jgi:hypothetical protein